MQRPILLIPAFDEESRIGGVLERVDRADLGFEVVVVDDGSRDRTADVARRAGATVLRHPFNLGYGAALQTGYKYALDRGAPLLVQMDADGQHEPRWIARLAEPVRAGESDLVIGSRFLGSDYQMGTLRSAGRTLFRLIARGFGLTVSDPTSGFQALNRSVLEAHAADSFPVDYPDVDVLISAHRRGFRIGEVSVEMSPSERASTLHGGFRSFYYVYKMLLSTFTTSKTSMREPGKEGGPK